MITRHAKPAAVLVPVSVGMPAKRKPEPMTREQFNALWGALAADRGDPTTPPSTT